jgi:methionyl-tRNA formyltransferase
MSGARVVLIGAVGSTACTLDGLLRHGVTVCGVLGLAQSRSGTVSGWRDICALARTHGIPAASFERVNDGIVLEQVRAWAPDVLLVVGLSQLVSADLLAVPTLTAIGFHPTRLPRGRGRAPLAWLALGAAPGAATFFLMSAGADEGPIVAQADFDVDPGDDAAAVEAHMLTAIARALDILAPAIRDRSLVPRVQDHAAATWLGRRTDEDGVIDWEKPAADVLRLIRASSPPNPGALTYVRDQEVRVLAAVSADADNLRWHGVAGRVLRADDAGVLVQCTDAPILLTKVEIEGHASSLPVGARLGYVADAEIAALRKRIVRLEEAITHIREALP